MVKKYEALTTAAGPNKSDGWRCGDILELDAKTAEPFVKAKALRPVDPEPVKKAAADKKGG